jgi:hypothetical protein
MFEVTNTGENHRETVLVGGGDDLFITYGTARLYYGRNPMLGGFIDAITEREESVGSEYRTFEWQQRSHGAEFD